jgi:lipopolysaccharide transport system ATP-binding protein
VGAQPAEFDRPDVCRVRLIGQGSTPSFSDTHYVRSLEVAGEGMEAQRVSLMLTDINQAEAALDLLGSEWGRYYSKDGHDCRILSPQTGRARGGQILLKCPPSSGESWHVSLTIETTSILHRESLKVQFLNYQSGEWQDADLVDRRSERGGWETLTVRMSIPRASEAEYRQAQWKIAENAKPDIEIMDVTVAADGEPTHVLEEGQAFQINVRLFAHRRVPKADLGLVITRSDGVYVFWESSDMDGQALREVEGEVTVCFIFQNSHIAHGSYYVDVVCGDTLDPMNRFRYNEVFDAKFRACTFTIKQRVPGLDFGLLYLRVPVSVTRQRMTEQPKASGA